MRTRTSARDIARSAGRAPLTRAGICTALLCATLLSCDRRPRQKVPRLPFDVRPTMGAMRLDCRTVQHAVEKKNLRAGLKAVERMREVRINRRKVAVPASFAAAEAALKERVDALADTMRADDQAGAEIALSAVLKQCNACHTTYRALGAEDALLR